MSVPNTNNNSQSTAQEIQNYIATIQAQYQAAEQYIEELEHSATIIGNDEQQIASLIPLEHTQTTHMNMYGEETVFTHTHQSVIDEVNSLNNNIASVRSMVAGSEAKLEAMDSSFSSLDNTLNGFLDAMTSIANAGTVGLDRIADDISHIQKYLSSVFQAMDDKLKADMDQAILQNDTQGNLSDGQMEQIAAQMIQAQTSEQNTLSQFVSSLASDFVAYHQTYDIAAADHESYNIFQEWFGNGDYYEKQDDRIEQNCQEMMSAIGNALSAITPEIANCTPVFTQIQVVLEIVMKKMEKILENTSLSPKEKLSAILGLMMFALGILSQIHQEVQSEKTKNQAQMSQANLYSTQMNMDDSVMNQKIQAEEAAKAKFMQTVMLVSQIVMGTLMALAAPGIGSFLLIAAFTALEATGEMNKVSTELGNKIGSQIWADVIVAAIEIAVTAGGGMLLDAGIKKLAASAVASAIKAAQESAEVAITAAAEKAAAAALKTGDKVAIAAAEKAIKETVEKAATSAANKMTDAFMNQAVPMLLAGGFKKSVEKATEEAVQIAIEDSSLLAECAANGVEVSAKEMGVVATRAANEAVANASGLTLKDAASQTGRTAGKKFLTRTAYAGLFSLGSANLLTDLSNAIEKARGKDANDKDYQNWLMALQIIQGIIEMIALVGGSGSASTLKNSTAGTILELGSRIALIPQATEAGANYSLGNIEMDQANTTEALSKNGAVADMLHAFLDQMQKDSNQERDRFMKAQSQELQANLAMSTRLHDGDNAGIQVLISGAA